MIIAVAADDQSLESRVSEEFESCKYLLIVDMDKMEFKAVENEGDPLGVDLARKITEYRCEGVVTGKLTPAAFEIMAEDGVTRFDGRGYSVKEALDLVDKRALELIKNPEGMDGCGGDHNHGGFLN